MGGSEKEETPIHKVKLTKPFAMARYKTTFDEYDRFAQATSRDLPDDGRSGRGSRSVVNVSWYEAKDYAQWLSQETGKRYRLPTEAEWEYVAQTWAVTKEDQLKNYAVRNMESVGSEQPNRLGFHDMSGSVSEWLEDCWHGDYTEPPLDGTAWLKTNNGDCNRRVTRGGSWYYKPATLGASNRYWNDADSRNKYVGFRLVQDSP